MLTISELLADESLRLSEFPAARNQIYLAHAGVSPLPKRVAERMSAYLTESQFSDQEVAAGNAVEETRRSVARLLQVRSDEVALMGTTSNSLSLIATGFPFQPGDNVVIYRDDYPSNVYPWMALESKGVEVRSIQVPHLGEITIENVMKSVDGRTRLAALSSCHFLSGFRIDLDAIGSALHEHGAAFCIDGIQSLGAFPTSLRHVDFMAADSRKWMLGPSASGVLFVRKEWQERLQPNGWGWHNLIGTGFTAADSLELRPSARRYEPGMANLAGLVGLGAAAELIQEVGLPAIATELKRKRAYLMEKLHQTGWEILGDSMASAHWGGMLSASHPRRNLEKVFQTLNQQKIRISLREIRGGRQYIRFSPHFYNTNAELDTALAALND